MTKRIQGLIDERMPSDISYAEGSNKFNYRVRGMIHDGIISAMHDERSSYDYLPGNFTKREEFE